MAKIVALDVLIGILKQVYAKTKEYTDGKISTSLDSLSSLIGTNSDNIKINGKDITTLKNTTNTQQESINGLQSRLGTAESNITTLKNTTNTQQESINGLQSRLGTAESNITTLQGELATVKSDVADLKGKVYDYLGNDEIDKVFEEAEKGA